MHTRRWGGFTLIELLATVAIIAIIAVVAIPGYEQSIRKTRRADGKAALSDIAQRLERCRTQFGAYDSGDCSIASPQNSEGGYYSIAVVRAATTYTLTATPQGAQASDGRCTTLVLNQLGQKTATGSAPNDCW
jgi:type IV pilus assembly protein PilE